MMDPFGVDTSGWGDRLHVYGEHDAGDLTPVPPTRRGSAGARRDRPPHRFFEIAGDDFGILRAEHGAQQALARRGGCSGTASSPLDRPEPAADAVRHLPQRFVDARERALAGGLQRIEPFALAAALGGRLAQA